MTEPGFHVKEVNERSNLREVLIECNLDLTPLLLSGSYDENRFMQMT